MGTQITGKFPSRVVEVRMKTQPLCGFWKDVFLQVFLSKAYWQEEKLKYDLRYTCDETWCSLETKLPPRLSHLHNSVQTAGRNEFFATSR